MKEKNIIKIWIIIGAIFFTSSIFLIIALFFVVNNDALHGLNNNSKKQNLPNLYTTNLVPNRIDGMPVETGKENLIPIAIMMDNHTDARPIAGLEYAHLVYEAEAEGGITRYLAFFTLNKPIDKIGPIRSARPYFVDWAHELSAVYVHCGGSPEALVKIAQDNVIDLNEFYNENIFWRDENRVKSHDLFTSTEKLKKFLDKKNLEYGKYFAWKFENEKKIDSYPKQLNIEIKFRDENYQVSWKYDAKKNNYQRFLGSQAHITEKGSQIYTKNLIIQYASAEEIDNELRLRMNHIGEGKAKICLNGSCQDGVWKKQNKTARTRYYNTTDNEIYFNPGTIWVEVVRPEIEVNIIN